MRSDVPTCALLSGGLDSSVIAAVARTKAADLRTFCAGSPLPIDCAQDQSQCDLSCARKVARALRTDHAEALVTREVFGERWPEMIRRMGMPLSTPNEVAINAVAGRLRADGCVVALSGEGADELFAGYELPMDQAAEFVRAGARDRSPGAFEAFSHSWIPTDFKPGLFEEGAWAACEEDRWLLEVYDREFALAAEECGGPGLAAHLALHRRINLTGLLARLDSATMLAGVEGRTPYADGEVAALAGSLPMRVKYRAPWEEAEEERPASDLRSPAFATATLTRSRTRSRTKMVLREAFAGVIPDLALERPKASFPLPFQQWIGDHAASLQRSTFAKEVFSAPAIMAVSQQPEKLWRLAWPMMNVALWGDAMGW